MAYTTFSTDNADYVLQLGNHILENRQVDIFEGIDALVIETGVSQFNEYMDSSWDEEPQYAYPLKFCAKNQILVFGTDVRGTELGDLRNYLSLFLTGVPRFIAGIYYGFSEKMINEVILHYCTTQEFLSQEPRIEGRNAVNARKIEEFVAPLMAERLGRKPYLGLIFGAGHMGLKPDLQSKRRRDFTIWNWRNFNFGKWAGFVEEDLNAVHEANFDREEWKIQRYTPPLFD